MTQYKLLKLIDILEMLAPEMQAPLLRVPHALWGVLFLLGNAPQAWAAGPEPVASPSVLPSGETTQPQVYQEVLERDYPLRRLGPLRLVNLRGAVRVRGWSLDRIRVRAVKRVRALSQTIADAQFKQIDLRFDANSVDAKGARLVELSAHYGQGLTIEERVRERQISEAEQAQMDLDVQIPLQQAVSILTQKGEIEAKNLTASIDAQTRSGALTLQNLRGKETSARCESCTVFVSDIQSALRVWGGDQPIEVSRVTGPEILIESTSGFIRLEKITGKTTLVSKSGSVFGDRLEGEVQIQSAQGSFQLGGLVGSLSGRTASGALQLKWAEWRGTEKVGIDSDLGSVRLEFPLKFSGELYVSAPKGEVFFDFPVRTTTGVVSRSVGGAREPRHELSGQVADRRRSDATLRVLSREGNIEVIRSPW